MPITIPVTPLAPENMAEVNYKIITLNCETNTLTVETEVISQLPGQPVKGSISPQKRVIKLGEDTSLLASFLPLLIAKLNEGEIFQAGEPVVTGVRNQEA